MAAGRFANIAILILLLSTPSYARDSQLLSSVDSILDQKEKLAELAGSFGETSEIAALSHLIILCPDCLLSDENGKTKTVLSWLLKEKRYNSNILLATHRDWLIALTAHLGLGRGEKIYFSDKTMTVGRIVEESFSNQFIPLPLEIFRKYDGPELGFTLEAFSFYTDGFFDAHINQKGRTFSGEELIDIVASRRLEEFSECGTHELIGLTAIYERYKNERDEKSEVWKKVERLIDKSLSRAKRFQRPNGAIPCIFSRSQIDRDNSYSQMLDDLNLTAHNLLWILRTGREQYLDKKWIQKAISFLTQNLENILAQYGDGRRAESLTRGEKLTMLIAVSHSFESLKILREKISE